MEKKSTLGVRLEEERKKRRLTQKKMGERLNLSHDCISNYEADKYNPSLDTLIEYSRIFNVSLDYLVFGTNRTYPLKLQHILHGISEAEQDKLFDALKPLIEYCHSRN